MATELDARTILTSLRGQQIRTVTGRPNTVLDIDDTNVLVGTESSPNGEPVAIQAVQAGIDRLVESGEVEVHPSTLGYRSSFVGAVLLTLPEAVVVGKISPPRIRLSDPMSAYRERDVGGINAWWASDTRQRFWLEITNRSDIGVDLHCPQRDANGRPTPGFSLIWCVRPDDVIFHYDLNQQAITAWSRAAGQVSEAPTIWLSHRAATRRRLRIQQAQPGWWLDLDGSFPVEPPLTLTEIRQNASALRRLLDQLRDSHPGSLYFPFSFYRGTQPRPQQPYLNKLPVELVDLFPTLAAAAVQATQAREPTAGRPRGLGTAYRLAQFSPLPTDRQPFTANPALLERGLRGHADTQNALAHALQQNGIEPCSRLPHEPNFDLAWKIDETSFVAEIKSITDDNEEDELRLGLGQVLRYRHRLHRLGFPMVIAVLVPERRPRDASWAELCQDLGVLLLSGDRIDDAPTLIRRAVPAAMHAPEYQGRSPF